MRAMAGAAPCPVEPPAGGVAESGENAGEKMGIHLTWRWIDQGCIRPSLAVILYGGPRYGNDSLHQAHPPEHDP